MRTLSTAELLAVWEQGAAQSDVERALLLLEAVCPDRSREALAELNIGERDESLLELRERLFGTMLHGLATCLQCHEVLELVFTVHDVRGAESSRLPAEAGGTAFSLQFGGYELRVRLPNSRDLQEVAAVNGLPEARRMLFERCVLGAQRNGETCQASEVPDEVLQIAEAQMAEADPQGDLQLSLTCPGCGHRWQAGLDIASFFWSEIHAWALRLLEDVHRLASAYGWREADILALSPWRRQAYLELVGQ
jgi:hypothetical protein